MNKLIPVICFIFSLVCAATATLGLVAESIACAAVSELAVVSVPIVIIGFVISGLSTLFTFMFRRDRLCRMSLYISTGALALSAVSVIIWLCM